MNEYLELKNLILNLTNTVNLLVPNKSTVSHICNISGQSRQTVTSYLYRNFEPESDFWKKNGKIEISKETTIALLRRYNEK